MHCSSIQSIGHFFSFPSGQSHLENQWGALKYVGLLEIPLDTCQIIVPINGFDFTRPEAPPSVPAAFRANLD